MHPDLTPSPNLNPVPLTVPAPTLPSLTPSRRATGLTTPKPLQLSGYGIGG